MHSLPEQQCMGKFTAINRTNFLLNLMKNTTNNQVYIKISHRSSSVQYFQHTLLTIHLHLLKGRKNVKLFDERTLHNSCEKYANNSTTPHIHHCVINKFKRIYYYTIMNNFLPLFRRLFFNQKHRLTIDYNSIEFVWQE